MRASLHHVSLHDFRSYRDADLELAGRSAFLVGPNGAGKTNLLEAVSLLSPGRGLRSANPADLGRRSPFDAPASPWGVSATVAVGDRQIVLGSGVDPDHPARRQVRIDREAASSARLADWVRPLWLTPAQDRLFLDGPADRRRFFDRLVFAAEPEHAGSVSAYERALRERARLLADGVLDPAWLGALESRMAKAGARIAAARARTVAALREEIEARAGGAFPTARLGLAGDWEELAETSGDLMEVETRLAAVLAAGRPADAAAGRTLSGPHRADLWATHAEKMRPAADCSTGEQKALILNLVLAQAARLSRAESRPRPILLLDEVAAHLDPNRRAALFDEVEALSLQALLTGTDEALFEPLRGRFLAVRVEASVLTLMED